MSVVAAERPRPKRWVEALTQARERMANAAEIVVEGLLNLETKFPVGEVTSPVVPATALVKHNQDQSVFAVVDGHLEELT